MGRKISLCLAALHSRTHLLWILARDCVLANTLVHPRTVMMLTWVFYRTILFIRQHILSWMISHYCSKSQTVQGMVILYPRHFPAKLQSSQPCKPAPRSKLMGKSPWSRHMASVHLSLVLGLLCVLTLLPLASCASKKTPKSKVSRSGHDLSHLATKLASWVRSWSPIYRVWVCVTLLATYIYL